jgi:uncharacterized SAM-dependent methyltransferase
MNRSASHATNTSSAALRSFATVAPELDLARDVFAGLRKVPRSLPCKYLYDARGARLFSANREQDEHCLTDAETDILRTHAGDLAALIGPKARLIELGGGEARKTELLLSALIDPVAYIPIDISAAELTLPPTTESARRSVVFFPGSMIGNLEPFAVPHFLARMAALAGSEGVVIVGVDLKKDPAEMVAAYDDRTGITAAFDKNWLARVNEACHANFALDGFRHRARWNAAFGRIEMLLESTRAQTVYIEGRPFHFAPGDTITTEHCYKYSLEEFRELALVAGLQPLRSFSDHDGWFSVHALCAPRHDADALNDSDDDTLEFELPRRAH